MSGCLTNNQIWSITLFVDHTTYDTYGYLMRSLDLDETLVAKKYFEKLVRRSDNTLKRYHADNKMYAENGFMA